MVTYEPEMGKYATRTIHIVDGVLTWFKVISFSLNGMQKQRLSIFGQFVFFSLNQFFKFR